MILSYIIKLHKDHLGNSIQFCIKSFQEYNTYKTELKLSFFPMKALSIAVNNVFAILQNIR